MPRSLLTFGLVVLIGGCAAAPDGPALRRHADWGAYIARDDATGAPRAAGAAGEPPADEPRRAGAGGRAKAFALPPEPGLSDLLTYAALHSDALKAGFHRWQAAVERIPQARALPDPKLTYGYYIIEVETRVGPQRQSVNVSQTFPWFGKLELRGGAAVEEAKAAWLRFQDEKLKLFSRVKAAYAEYYYLGRSVAVTRDSLKLLEQLERLVRTRYRTATASHPDLIRLQIEVSTLRDRLSSLEAMRGPALAALDAAMGRRAGAAALPWPGALPLEPVAASHEALVGRLRARNLALAALDAEAAAAEKRVELAKKDYWPDVTLGATYIDTGRRAGQPDSSQPAVIGLLSVNVPIWRDKLDAAVRAARHGQVALSARRDQAASDLEAELATELYHVRDARRKIELYVGTLIPKAREHLRVTQTAYASGASDFADVIDALRVLLEFELSHDRALTDHAARRAALERLIGGALEPPGHADAAPTTTPAP